MIILGFAGCLAVAGTASILILSFDCDGNLWPSRKEIYRVAALSNRGCVLYTFGIVAITTSIAVAFIGIVIVVLDLLVK